MKKMYILLISLCIQPAAYGNNHTVRMQQEAARKQQEEAQRIAAQQEEAQRITALQRQNEKQPIISAQTNQIALPDWKRMHAQLCAGYQNILVDTLEEYKKADITVMPWNMDELMHVGALVTKFDHSAVLHALVLKTKDEQNDSFFHRAVEKNDVPTVQWLSSRIQNNQYLDTNNDGQTPLDLCIKKLLPIDVYNRAQERTLARKIFDIMLSAIGKLRIAPELKEKCLTSIINLQLQWRGYGIPFHVEQDLLTNLIEPEKLEQEPSFMNRLYREAKYSGDRTFTHVFIAQSLPDDLFEWVKKGQVSFAKDASNHTALDYALLTLRGYTQDEIKRTKFLEHFKRVSCCVYILLNYARSLGVKEVQVTYLSELYASDISDFGPCCEKHTL